MYPYIHSQHVPHYIWTSSTLFRYLLQSFQRSGSFFSDFARSHLIFFFWLGFSPPRTLERSLQEVAEVSAGTKSISYRSEDSLHPKKKPLTALGLCGGEGHLALSEFFSRFNGLFCRLDFAGWMFSRAWNGLSVIPHLVECFPALDRGWVFLLCRFLFYWRWSLARQGRRLQNHGTDGWRH